MFFSKKEDTLDLTVDNLISLNDRFNDYINSWVAREIKDREAPKMRELIVSNLKILYGTHEEAKQMRNFFFTRSELDTEFLLSRIHDLYLTLQMEFPAPFLKSIERRFMDALDDLGYPIDQISYEQFPFGWLLHKIQFVIRYNFK